MLELKFSAQGLDKKVCTETIVSMHFELYCNRANVQLQKVVHAHKPM